MYPGEWGGVPQGSGVVYPRGVGRCTLKEWGGVSQGSGVVYQGEWWVVYPGEWGGVPRGVG